MKKAFAAPILQRLGEKIGIKVIIEPTYKYAGQIILSDGTKRYFLRTTFDLNPSGASEIARDKSYATFFMQQMGYSVIEGEAFFSPEWVKTISVPCDMEAAYQYAKRIGFPVIVKPNSLSQGVGVAKVYNKQEFMRAVKMICEKDKVFLVQREVHGRDYRVVVLDNEIMSAYERLPLSVAGDGISTIAQLVEQKQKLFTCTERGTKIEFDDIRITNRLRRLGCSRSTVLPNGKSIALLDNRNLSSGGDAIDITKEIHPSFAKLCIALTKDMGLRYCGVDLMVDGDICEPIGKYWVIEINDSPGIDNYASVGSEQKRIVESMYLKVLLAITKSNPLK